MKRRTLNIQLTDKEFQKLSEETGVSQYDIQKLYSMGILRDYSLVSLLIRHDFKTIFSVSMFYMRGIRRAGLPRW